MYFRHSAENECSVRKHAENLEIDFFNLYLSSLYLVSLTLNLNLAVRDDNLQDYAVCTRWEHPRMSRIGYSYSDNPQVTVRHSSAV